MRDWRRQQKQLQSLKLNKKKGVEGGGGEAAHSAMEEDDELVALFATSSGSPLNFFQGAGEDVFVASKGWLEKMPE